MNAERWKEVQRLFHAALELPRERRGPFLSDACNRDAELRAEVEALIVEDAAGGTGLLHGTSDDALGDLAADLLGGDVEGPPCEGRRVGPYTILRQIGRGGMGTVYLAERRDVGLTAALKLVAGALAAPDRVPRFLFERRLLARLDHPHIARLLDAGVAEDGTPWFAMEFVEGKPIDRFCDERGLSVRERLALFERVCEAVAFAHRNLVVHRDLKPGNIFVSDDGVPKLLDFGIAKLLEGQDEGLTATGARLLTPDYAAPEQLAGAPATTASDVYGLGLVLCELLVGCRPAHSADGTMPGPPPRRPAGDPGCIAMHALAEEPERRYPSADALLDDLRRFREGRPIQARPDSAGYRARAFVRRHRLPVAAVALLLVLLTGFAAMMAVEQTRTAGERDRAEAALARVEVEAEKSGEVSDFLASLFTASDPFAATSGADVTVRDLLEIGVARVDSLAAQPEVQAAMLEVMGRVYRQLGQYPRARELQERGLEIRVGLHPGPHPDVAASMNEVGIVLELSGDLEGAEAMHRAALGMRQHLWGKHHADVAQSLTALGIVAGIRGDFGSEERLQREALATYRSLDPPNPRAISSVLNNLANASRRQGELAEAEAAYREALALNRSLHDPRHPQVALTLSNLGAVLLEMERPEEAEAALIEALDIRRATLDPEHPGTAATLNHLARTVAEQGRLAEAEPLFHEALAIRRAVLGASHQRVGMTLTGLAELHGRRGENATADSLYGEALAIYRNALPAEHADIADVLSARAALRLGDGQAAEPVVSATELTDSP